MTPALYTRYLGEYLASQAFLFLSQALPLPLALRMGEWAGHAVMPWTRRNQVVAMDNLLHAFPGMSESEAQAFTRRVYEHFGRASVEIAVAHRMLRESTWRDRIEVRNEHYLREVLAEGKGAIFITGHVGVWEVFGLVLKYYGVRPVSVYRPVKNPFVDRFIRKRRSAFGQTMIERDGALPTLLRALRKKGYIALLVDQHAKRDGVWVPFFGRVASTTPAPALLALRTGAPIITGYGRRLPGEYRFEAFVDEPLRVQPTGDRDADVRRVTEEISRRLEGYVRQAPEQWLWLHRRWRDPNRRNKAKGNGNVGPSGETD